MIKRTFYKGKVRLLWGMMLTVSLLSGLLVTFAGASEIYGSPPVIVTRTLPSSVSPGQTFNVTVTFTAPADNFNAIGLSDFAPIGWSVAVDNTWNTPNSDTNNITANRIDYIWDGPFANGTSFVAVYHVTVPANATPGTYYFTNSSPTPFLEYYVAGGGPYDDNIGGQSQVTIPSYALTVAASPGTGGTATDKTGGSPYAAGAKVSITAAAKAGYHFVNWTATAGTFANASLETTTFTMPGAATTVTANFAITPAPPTTVPGSSNLGVGLMLVGLAMLIVLFTFRRMRQSQR